MSTNQFVVRIVQPSAKPALPKVDNSLQSARKNANLLFSKIMNVSIGSLVGITAGVVIYLMLKIIGLNIGGVESSVIIGLPSILMILASFVIC
ncbi:MAG: hypothetical protein KJ732_08200 [Candidatus Margulisbacteria bacterium]|nr:hypothetical protein [Candidatus Margulisiibacteriota bacterium]